MAYWFLVAYLFKIMPRFAQLVIGPAGCGKSTYCSTMQAHCETLRRKVDVVNLDPAAEFFEYTPLADIRDLIHLDDVMEDEAIRLGPNGGLIFCLEYLQQNLNWLDTALGDIDGDYLLFDCPGQIELYSHLPIMPRIIEYMQRKWDFRFVTIFILDARFLVDSSHFLAGVLSALSAMVSLSTAHINVMSKLDLLSEQKQKYVMARYLNPDMDYFFDLDQVFDEEDGGEHHEKEAPFNKLTHALADLIERYSVVHFVPLNRDKEDTITDLLVQIDQCLQYDEEVDPSNRAFDDAEQELCKSVNSGSHTHLFLETLTHGLTGSMFWLCCLISINGKLDLYTTGYRKNIIMTLESCFWAAFGAILPDIDHFIASGSTSIELARQLPGRPFLHWAGLYLLIYTLLIIGLFFISYPICLKFNRFFTIFWCFIFIPFISHIIRDANKRGLWLWPPPDFYTLMNLSNFTYNILYPSNPGMIHLIRTLLLYLVVLMFIILRWIARQRSDPYVKRAHLESYRCRSAFKLLQLNDKISGGIFKPGDIVVDCGAAPGSWCQVASSLTNCNNNFKASNNQNKGLVVGLDLLNFAPLPGVITYCGVDLNNWSECINLINQSISNHFNNNDNGRKPLQSERQKSLPGVDIVLSDIAPNVSGMREIDIPAMMTLAYNILRVAISVSKEGASFVIKLFESAEAEEFKQTVSQFYTLNSKCSSFTRFIKPEASRKESSEIYLVARGFQLPQSRQDS
ncbi:GPN-loop GTPase 3, variant 2 [Schistosoma haematobium]|uniref:GPN-loop GTPase 3 n=2 Tax=Schistosoma haematobium TaxID=6185 RepID=A0A922INW0_SCHHA|nr:GPN-loop GTPase 3, variant 2 [Schistosoma haematobium]KAH9583724.1 GPN-loop GTPase 3, variant 2 [Schistosoma haematobium]